MNMNKEKSGFFLGLMQLLLKVCDALGGYTVDIIVDGAFLRGRFLLAAQQHDGREAGRLIEPVLERHGNEREGLGTFLTVYADIRIDYALLLFTCSLERSGQRDAQIRCDQCEDI